jgi:hypothetical protein
MQLVDGMDNFSVVEFRLGNLIISEIDVQSVELCQGSFFPLYGANAFNGILFMNSKRIHLQAKDYRLCKLGQICNEQPEQIM